MIVSILAGLLAASAQAAEPRVFAQLIIRERVIVKVPTLPPPPRAAKRAKIAPAKPIEWKESKGPKCVAIRALAGAAVTQRDNVDLVLRGGSRVRARLERGCRALDFYRGFYLKPAADGRICADRDTIHDRSGNQCEVTAFRALTPKR